VGGYAHHRQNQPIHAAPGQVRDGAAMDYAGNPNSVFVEAIVRKYVLVLMALLLAGAPGLALAHNCPNEMKAIDAKLSTRPALSPEDSAKVAKLRADGEAYHKAGKHDEAMKSLLEAKKILGI
jgi:hypothetical protein